MKRAWMVAALLLAGMVGGITNEMLSAKQRGTPVQLAPSEMITQPELIRRTCGKYYQQMTASADQAIRSTKYVADNQPIPNGYVDEAANWAHIYMACRESVK